MLKILWISREAGGENDGDAIFDRKLIGALCESGCSIVRHEMLRASAPRRIRNMLARFSLPDRAVFGSVRDSMLVSSYVRMQTFDAAIVSHEHLDDAYVRFLLPILKEAGIRSHVVLHNVTSRYVDQRFGFPMGAILHFIYGRYERRIYVAANFATVFCLNRTDCARIGLLQLGMSAQEKSVVDCVFPGVPSVQPVHRIMPTAREIIISGSYSWRAKRDSLDAFADDFARSGLNDIKLLVDREVPLEVSEKLRAQSLPAGEADNLGCIRFGLITDRFSAGHKLKTTAYLLANCVVISYADVIDDFAEAPHAAFFIRRVSTLSDIERIVNEFSALPAEQISRQLFELQCWLTRHRSWASQAAVVLRTLRGQCWN